MSAARFVVDPFPITSLTWTYSHGVGWRVMVNGPEPSSTHERGLGTQVPAKMLRFAQVRALWACVNRAALTNAGRLGRTPVRLQILSKSQP